MTHHRPKSPSPTQLPPVGDTVIGLEPVGDTGANLQVPAPQPDATSPELPPAREITAPMEIPQHLKVPGLNQGTTPGTPLSIAAPQLAKIAHSDLHRAHAPSVAEMPPAVTPIDLAKALGPAFDEMTLREPPAKKHDSGPRRSHPEMPVAAPRPSSGRDHHPISDVPTGPPRKSKVDMPALADATVETPRKNAAAITDKRLTGLSAQHEGSTGPLLEPHGAVPVRKSRTDVPAQRGRGGGSSGEKKAARGNTGDHPAHSSGPKKAAAITAPIEVPPPLEAETQLQLGEPASTPVHPSAALNGRTVMKTLPSVPPVLPFGGIDDPRFKLGAMIAGVVLAVVAMSVVSWALLKHEPPMPPEDALKPAFVELPAPPRHDEPDDAPVVAAAPKIPMIEIQLDGGRTALVPAGILKVFSDPDCTVFADGRELGPTPAAAQLPAGKVTLVLVNTKIGLHMVETVELKAGETKNAEYTFAPGFLEVVADDDAKLTVDGKAAKPGSMQVWQGSHRVEAIYGHEKVAKSAQVLAGATTTVELHQIDGAAAVRP